MHSPMGPRSPAALSPRTGAPQPCCSYPQARGHLAPWPHGQGLTTGVGAGEGLWGAESAVCREGPEGIAGLTPFLL